MLCCNACTVWSAIIPADVPKTCTQGVGSSNDLIHIPAHSIIYRFLCQHRKITSQSKLHIYRNIKFIN